MFPEYILKDMLIDQKGVKAGVSILPSGRVKLFQTKMDNPIGRTVLGGRSGG